MHNQSAFTILVDELDSGKRLDLFIASRISVCSRSMAASLIRKGEIRVQGAAKKPGYRIRAGDEICGLIPPTETVLFEPEPVKIDILYEDDYIIVVNNALRRYYSGSQPLQELVCAGKYSSKIEFCQVAYGLWAGCLSV